MDTLPEQIAARMHAIKSKLIEIDSLLGQSHELARDGKKDFPELEGQITALRMIREDLSQASFRCNLVHKAVIRLL
jgi:two-component sensor histidine kinase